MSSASKVTAHVIELTLVTASVGLSNSFQFAAVLYGSALSTYVLLSAVTIPISHCSAVEREVKSDLLVTVKVSVKATHGNIVVASFQLLSNTGTFHDDVHVSLLAAVHRVTPLSLISFQLVQSNNTISQSVEDAGHDTSHVPPHHQAHHWNVSWSTYTGTSHT
jgi:hypothetical protein